VLQCVAEHVNEPFIHSALRCSVLQCAPVCCGVLGVCVAVCCSVLQCVAVCCSVLHCVMQCVLKYVLQCVLQCMLQCMLQYVLQCVPVDEGVCGVFNIQHAKKKLGCNTHFNTLQFAAASVAVF